MADVSVLGCSAPLRRERLAVNLPGLRKLSLLLEDVGKGVDRDQRARVVRAELRLASRQRPAHQRIGLVQFALVVEQQGEIVVKQEEGEIVMKQEEGQIVVKQEQQAAAKRKYRFKYPPAA